MGLGLNRIGKTVLIVAVFRESFLEMKKMKLKQIAQELDAKVVCGGDEWGLVEIKTIFASDLMSDVLMSDRDDMLVVTSLSTEQSVRSAGIVGAEALLIANNKTVSDGMVVLANELEVVLLCTRFPKYETCVKIGKIMEQE